MAVYTYFFTLGDADATPKMADQAAMKTYALYVLINSGSLAICNLSIFAHKNI